MTSRLQWQIFCLEYRFLHPCAFGSPEPGCRQAPAPAFTCLPSSGCQWLRLQICLYLEEQVCGWVLNQVSALLVSSWCISYSWNNLIWKRATCLPWLHKSCTKHIETLCHDFYSLQIQFTVLSLQKPASVCVCVCVCVCVSGFLWEKELEALYSNEVSLEVWVISYLCDLGMTYNHCSSLGPFF